MWCNGNFLWSLPLCRYLEAYVWQLCMHQSDHVHKSFQPVFQIIWWNRFHLKVLLHDFLVCHGVLWFVSSFEGWHFFFEPRLQWFSRQVVGLSKTISVIKLLCRIIHCCHCWCYWLFCFKALVVRKKVQRTLDVRPTGSAFLVSLVSW